jgi:DNA repair exonuclease SbcCD ATPase subunit
MGVIFDEILGEIETRTNKMMESLPNVANFTFSVSSTKTTQKGAIKKSICTKLLCGGTEVDLDVVSGGQMGVVELCADLAVSETIRARFGSKLGFVILDEALENLGGYEKGLALEAIKANIRGQVLIVDHASEIKEGFASVIEIEFDGKNSKII